MAIKTRIKSISIYTFLFWRLDFSFEFLEQEERDICNLSKNSIPFWYAQLRGAILVQYGIADR